MTQTYGMGSPIIRPLGRMTQNIMATPIGGTMTTPQVSTAMPNPMTTPQVSTVMPNPMTTPQVSTVMPNPTSTPQVSTVMPNPMSTPSVTTITPSIPVSNNQQLASGNFNGIGQTAVDRYSTTRPLSAFYNILNSTSDLSNLLAPQEFYKADISQIQAQTLTSNQQVATDNAMDNFVTMADQNINRSQLNATDSADMTGTELNQFLADNFTNAFSSTFELDSQQDIGVLQSNVVSNRLTPMNLVNQSNQFYTLSSTTVAPVQSRGSVIPLVLSTNNFYNSSVSAASISLNVNTRLSNLTNRFYSSRN